MSEDTDRVLAEARALGAEAGKQQASWVFDGNTPDETYAAFINLSDEGDPAIDAFGPPSWLSGEWAGDLTPQALAEDLGILFEGDEGWNEDFHGWLLDSACNAYEESADEAYWAELERVAREMTS